MAPAFYGLFSILEVVQTKTLHESLLQNLSFRMVLISMNFIYSNLTRTPFQVRAYSRQLALPAGHDSLRTLHSHHHQVSPLRHRLLLNCVRFSRIRLRDHFFRVWSCF